MKIVKCRRRNNSVGLTPRVHRVGSETLCSIYLKIRFFLKKSILVNIVLHDVGLARYHASSSPETGLVESIWEQS